MTTTLEERRELPLATAGVSIRADGTGQERFHGYAAVFNSRTAIGNPMRWGFYEEVAPGAFTKTLSEGDSRKLIDHDSYYVVSRVSAGTLLLAQDQKGLEVDSALDPALSYVNDLKANVRNGNITGMSFGFYVVKDAWSTEEIEVAGYDDPIEVEIRRILEARLIEVSSVTFPAYEETEAGLRSVAAALAHRADPAAIERRAAYKPELLDLMDLRQLTNRKKVDGEPGETTRQQDAEPGRTTRLSPGDLINVYGARYGLPIGKDN